MNTKDLLHEANHQARQPAAVFHANRTPEPSVDAGPVAIGSDEFKTYVQEHGMRDTSRAMSNGPFYPSTAVQTPLMVGSTRASFTL